LKTIIIIKYFVYKITSTINGEIRSLLITNIIVPPGIKTSVAQNVENSGPVQSSTVAKNPGPVQHKTVPAQKIFKISSTKRYYLLGKLDQSLFGFIRDFIIRHKYLGFFFTKYRNSLHKILI